MSEAASRIVAILAAEVAKHCPEPGMTPMEAIIGRRMSIAECDLAERCLMTKLQQYLDTPITPESEAEVARTILEFAKGWSAD